MKISARTIQRDMDLLQKSGFPIAMAPETNEFYLVSNYGVPVVQLSFSESMAMMILLLTAEEQLSEFVCEAKKGILKYFSSD